MAFGVRFIHWRNFMTRLEGCFKRLFWFSIIFLIWSSQLLAVNAPVITHVMGKPVVAGATHYANVNSGILVRGNAEALTTIRLFKAGSQVGTTTTDATGVWVVSFDSFDGIADYDADANDGTFTSARCPSVKIQIDTNFPTANLLSGFPYAYVSSGYYNSSNYYHYVYDSGAGIDFNAASMTIVDLTAGVSIPVTLTNDAVNKLFFAPVPNDSAIKVNGHEYRAYLEFADKAGNITLASETFYCDFTAPVTTITHIYDPDHTTITGDSEPNPNPPDADGWVPYYKNMTITRQPTKIRGITEQPAPYNGGFGTYYVQLYLGSWYYNYFDDMDTNGSFTVSINAKFYTSNQTVSIYTRDCAGNYAYTYAYLKFVNPCPDPVFLKVYDPAHHDFSGILETSANTPDGEGYVNYFPGMKISTRPTKIIGKIDPTNMYRFYLTDNYSLMPGRYYYVGTEIDAVTGSFTANLDGDFWNGTHTFSFRIYDESGGSEYRNKSLTFIDGNLPRPGSVSITSHPQGSYNVVPIDNKVLPTISGNASLYSEPQVVWLKGNAGGVINTDYQYATVVLPNGQTYPNIAGAYDQGDVWQDKNQNGQWDSDEPYYDMPARGVSDGRAFSIPNFLGIEAPDNWSYTWLYYAYARSPHYDSTPYYGYYWFSNWTYPHTIKSFVLTPDHANPYRNTVLKPTKLVVECSKPSGNYSPANAYGLLTAESPVSILNALNQQALAPVSNWNYQGTPEWHKSEIDLSATTFAEGTYRIRVYLKNIMHVVTEDESNYFLIDNTAPMAQNFSPSEGQISNSFTSFNAQVVDPYLADNSNGSGLNLDVALSQIWPFRLLTDQFFNPNNSNTNTLTFSLTDGESYAKNHRGEVLAAGTVLDAWKVVSGQYQNDTIAVKVFSNPGDGTLTVETVSGLNFAKNTVWVVLFAIPSFTSNNGIDRVGAVPISPVTEDAKYVCRVLTLDKSGNQGAFYAPYSTLELAAGPITLTTDRTFLFLGLVPPDLATFTSSAITTRKGNIVADGQAVTVQRSPESLTSFTLPDANGLPGDGYQVLTGQSGAPVGEGRFVYGVQVTGSTESTLETVCGIGLASGSSTPIPIVRVDNFSLVPATTTPAITPGNPTADTSVACSLVGYMGTPVPDGSLATWTVTDHLLDNPTGSMYSMTGYYDSYWYPNNLSDGNVWSYGQRLYGPSFTQPMPGAGFTVDLGEGNEKEWVRVEAWTNSGLTIEYDIQYSDDSLAWTTVYSNYMPTGSSNWTQASWAHSGKHRYWRLIQTNTPSYYYHYLYELKWYTNPARPTVTPDNSPLPGIQASLTGGLSTVFASAQSKGPVTFKMEVAGKQASCVLNFLDRYPPDPPEITLVSPQYSQGTTSLTWTESPDYGGAGTMDYFVDQSFNGGAFTEVLNVATITGTITGLADGEYSFRIRPRDNDGNIGNPSVASFCIVDTVAPPPADCSDIGPANNDPDEHFSVDPNITFYFSPTDDRSGVAEVNIQVATATDFAQLADDAWVPITTAWQFTGGISGYDYYARVRVKDRSGNIGTFGAPSNGIRVHYTGATTPPNAPIITMIDGKVAVPGTPVKTNKTVDLAIDGMSESSNLVELWIDGAYQNSIIAAADGKYTHLASLAQGVHTVKTRSHNGFAQSAFSGEFQIIVDTTAPVLDLRMYMTGNWLVERNWVSRTGNDHNITHLNLVVSDSGGAGFDINVASISVYDIDDSGVPLPSDATYPNPLVGAASPIAADTAQFIPDSGWAAALQDQHRYRIFFEATDEAGNRAYNSRDIAIDSLRPGQADGVPATSTPPLSNFRGIYVYNAASYTSGLPPFSELVPTIWSDADNAFIVDPAFNGNAWVDNSTSPVALLFNTPGIYGHLWTASPYNPPAQTGFDTKTYATGIAWGWGDSSITTSANTYGHVNWYQYKYRTIVNGIHVCQFYIQDSAICRDRPNLKLNIQSPMPAPHAPIDARFYDAYDPALEFPTRVWTDLFAIPGNWMYALDTVVTRNSNPLLIKVQVPLEDFDQTIEIYTGATIHASATIPQGSDMAALLMELSGTEYRRQFQIRTRANGYVSMNLPRESVGWDYGYIRDDVTPPLTYDLIPVEQNYNAKTGATARPFPNRFSVRVKDSTDGSNISYLHLPTSLSRLQDYAGNPIGGTLVREYDPPATAYGFRYDLSVAPTAEGTYYYYIQLNDAAQPTANSFVASFAYRLDKSPPAPANVSPADGATTNSLPSFSCQSVDPLLADGTPGSGPNMDPSLVQVEPYKELGRNTPVNGTTLKVSISGIDTVATDHVDNPLPVGTLVSIAKVQGTELKPPQRAGTIVSNGSDIVEVTLIQGTAMLTSETYAVIWAIPTFQSNDGIDRLAAVPIQPAVKGGSYVAYFTLSDKSLNMGSYSSASSIYEAAYGPFALSTDRTSLYAGLVPPHAANYVSAPIMTTEGNTVQPGTMVTVFTQPPIGAFGPADANGIPGDGHQVACDAAGKLNFQLLASGTATGLANVKAVIGLANGSDSSVIFVSLPPYTVNLSQSSLTITSLNLNPSLTVSAGTFGNAGDLVPDGTMLNCQTDLGSFLPADAMPTWPGHQIPISAGATSFSFTSDTAGTAQLSFECGGITVVKTVNVIDQAPPTAPGIPDISPLLSGTGNLLVTWGAATDPGNSGIAGYELEYSLNNGAWVTCAVVSIPIFNTSDLAHGFYRFRARAKDTAGNIGPYSGESVQVEVDRLPPFGSITIDSGATVTATTTVTLTLTYSDANGVDGMSFSNDGTVWSSWQALGTTFPWTVPPGDGFKIIFARFIDSLGNVSVSYQDDIRLDTSPPAGTVAIEETPYTGTVGVKINSSINDATNISTMYIQNSGQAVVSAAYVSQYLWNLTSGDGLKTVYISYEDSLGNRSASYTVTTTLDTTGPTKPVVTDDGNYSPFIDKLHASWVTTDAASGISHFLVRVGTAAGLADVVAETNVGIASETTFTGLTLDLSGATQYYFTVFAVDNAGNTSLAGTSDGIKGGDPTPPEPINVYDDGAYSAISTSLHATWDVAVDPDSNINRYEFSAGSSPGATDLVAWVNLATAYAYTATGLTLANGQLCYINIRVYNNGGVSSTNVSDGIVIDTAPPPVPVLQAETTWSGGDANLSTCNAVVDALSGGVLYQFERATNAAFTLGLASSGWISANSYSFSGLSHGVTYYYRVKAKDAVGNESGYSNVESSIQDTTPPSCTAYSDNVALNADPDGQWSRDLSVSFAPIGLTQDLAPVKNVYLEIANENTFAAPLFFQWINNTTGEYTYTAPNVEDSTIYARAKFEDEAGNVSGFYNSDGITLDLTNPVAGATDDVAGNTDNDHTVSADAKVYFNFSHSDGVSGVADIYIQIARDAGFTDVAFEGWLGQTPVPTQHLFENGEDSKTYYARILAKDHAGRTSATWGGSSDGIRIDLSAPDDSGGEMFLINKKDGLYASEKSTASPSVFLTLMITDPSGVDSAAVSNDNIKWTIWNNPALNPASHSWDLSSGEGNKTIYMYFIDGVGHISPVKTQTIEFRPNFIIQTGTRDQRVYPVDTYDEYRGQNKYGTDRSQSSAPNQGKSLKLKTP